MKRVLIVGAAGRMGRIVVDAIATDPELGVAAAVDRPDHPELGKEIASGVALSADLAAGVDRCDVAIDFSTPASTLALVEAAALKPLPVVIATTGLSASDRERIQAAAQRSAIVLAPNFSIAVNVLMYLTELAAKLLPGYDVDILELHHNQKVDAPSGTAVALGELVAGVRGESYDEAAVYHREGHTGARPPQGTIGMQTLRLGDAPGEHTVYFAGPGERIELTSRALSRSNFATGACRAARWVIDRPPGLHSMRDVLGL